MNYQCFECDEVQENSGRCNECDGSTEMIRDPEGEAIQAYLGDYLQLMEKNGEDV